VRARLSIGGWTVEPDLNTARLNGTAVRLEPKVMEVCLCLADHAGEVVSKELLFATVWPDTFVTEDVLVHAVSELRKTFRDNVRDPQFIETIPKRGYRLIAPVQRDIPENTEKTKPPAPAVRSRYRFWIPCAVVLALVIAGASLSRFARKTPARNATRAKFDAVPIVTYADGGQWLPAFSPDGTRMAYALRTPEAKWFLEMKILGQDTRIRLTPDGSMFPPAPAWSPDGTQIAFVRAGESDDRGLFVVSALGGPLRKLRSVSRWQTPQRMVSWSPDGRWLAFSDAANDPAKLPHKIGPNAIYLLSLETLEARQLTHPADDELGDAAPAFSPDGNTIAFVHTTAETRDELSLLPIGGGPIRKLIAPGIWTNGLAWSADGQSLVFDRSMDGGFRIWRTSIHGGDARKVDLPADRANLLEPALWKDHLAYEFHETLGTMGRVPLDHFVTQAPKFPMASTRYDHNGRYSPAGDQIAFISDRTGNDEVWLANADGSNALQLTHFRGAPLLDVSWAPDGHAIAASRAGGTVYLASVPSGSVRLIFNQQTSLGEGENIAFSRDGKYVYVISQPANRAELVKAPVDGGAPVKVLDEIVTRVVESPDGKTLFYSRPTSLLAKSRTGIWSRPVEGGQEKFVHAFANYWTILPGGLYVVDEETEQLEKYSLSGKHVQTVAKRGAFFLGRIFSIAPDARHALFDYDSHIFVEIDMVKGLE
jgi:Tol biopolymer transport system component/DNA-binding winged helix-turn-helix (wHTH) protein